MARSFSDEEKEHIRARLLELGREYFARYGLKKTSIEELTAPVGIAKSTFYLFFDSKEALYMALLIADAEEVKRRILAASFDSTDDMREAIRRYIHGMVEIINSNPMYRRLINHPDEAQAVVRRVMGEYPDRPNPSIQTLLPYILRGQEQGQVIPGDPAVIAAAMRAVVMLILVKDSVGHDDFDAVFDLLAELVAVGLTRTSD